MSGDVTPIACPACGHEWSAEVWEALNPDREPMAREWLRGRSLHRPRCPMCRIPVVVDIPVLYTDFDLGLWVHCLPEVERGALAQHEAEARQVFTEAFDPARASPAAVELGADLRLQVVFGLEELREAMILGEAGLDPLVTEVLKLEVLMAHPELKVHDVRRVVLDAVNPDLLHLAVYTGDDLMLHGHFAVQRSMYDQLASRRDTLAAHYPGLAAGLYVSALRYRAEEG